MKMPPLLADFTHARPCKPFCEKYLTLPDFAARERMREAKPVKLKKVAFSHFFDTLRRVPYGTRLQHICISVNS